MFAFWQKEWRKHNILNYVADEDIIIPHNYLNSRKAFKWPNRQILRNYVPKQVLFFLSKTLWKRGFSNSFLPFALNTVLIWDSFPNSLILIYQFEKPGQIKQWIVTDAVAFGKYATFFCFVDKKLMRTRKCFKLFCNYNQI